MQSNQISNVSVPANFASLLDVSLHRAYTTPHEIKELCDLGVQMGFNVVSNSCYTKLVRQYVGESASIEVDGTVGFPFGTASTIAKVTEAEQAVRDGASEIDMVLAIGMLKEGLSYYTLVKRDIEAVVEAVHQAGGKATKVIIETCYLNKAEKEAACQIVSEAGAEFIKTSTGYGTGGATIADVRLMRRLSAPNVKVKAAGGIRTLSQCLEFLDAGVCRLGVGLPGALAILEEVRQRAADA